MWRFWCCSAAGCGRSIKSDSLLEDVFDEALALELLELIRLFPGPDEAGRDVEFLLDRGGNASFARAIKLSKDETVERNGF